MNAICLIFSLTNSMGMNLREFKDFVLPVIVSGRKRWVTGGKPISAPERASLFTTILLHLLAVKTDKRNFRRKIPPLQWSYRPWKLLTFFTFTSPGLKRSIWRIENFELFKFSKLNFDQIRRKKKSKSLKLAGYTYRVPLKTPPKFEPDLLPKIFQPRRVLS